MLFKRRNKTRAIFIDGLRFAVCLLILTAATSGQKKVAVGERTEVLLVEAADALASGDLLRADALTQKVIAVAPRNSAAHTLAGVVADRRNELPKAEKHFAAAVRFAPQKPETRNNYGAILLRLDRKAEAAKEFGASLKLNPNQPSALVNLAQIRFAENDFAAARELFTKAKSIAPDAEILRALILIALRGGEKEGARRSFREYSDFAERNGFQPKDSSLGAALLAGGLFAEAQRELETVLKKSPNDRAALITLARVFLAQNNVRGAGKLLESAVASGRADALVYATLAEVYQAAGYIENAIPSLRLAIEREPANDFYQARYGMLLIDSKAPAAAIIRMREAATSTLR